MRNLCHFLTALAVKASTSRGEDASPCMVPNVGVFLFQFVKFYKSRRGMLCIHYTLKRLDVADANCEKAVASSLALLAGISSQARTFEHISFKV